MKWLTLLLALVVAVPSVAQDDAKADYEKLSSELKKAEDDARAAMKALSETQEYKDLLAAARKNRDRASFDALNKFRSKAPRVNRAEWAPRYSKYAEIHAGTAGAVPFLSWLAMNGGKDHAPGALRVLTDDHSASAEIGDVVDRAVYMGRSMDRGIVRAFASAVIKNNASTDLKAAAYYARASNYGVMEGRRTVLTEEEEAMKAADEAALIKLAPESIPALRIKAPEFVKNRLQIGMTVPEIEGVDIDGVNFKLSDYRGKVVVLDFWGDW